MPRSYRRDIRVWLLLALSLFLPMGCGTFIQAKATILLDTSSPGSTPTTIPLEQLQRVELATNRTEAAASVAEHAARKAGAAAQKAEIIAQKAETAAQKAGAAVEKIKRTLSLAIKK